MNEHDKKVLKQIYRHINQSLEYCQDCDSLEEFEANTMRLEATVFNLMQVGEIAKQGLSDDAKEQMPDIPWHEIYGMRNRIVHAYDGVDMNIIWETVSEDFQELKASIEQYIDNDSAEDNPF